MGCQLTKDEPDTMESPARQSNPAEAKATVEKKMCLARETPEPIFDLSECYLKEVPSGVFVLCRVLRKEVLLLHCNGLTSLKGGGLCSDLSLIRVLDLRQNRIKKLPDEIGLLQEIRELFLSENGLEVLPKTINRLQKLEILDVSQNKLTSVQHINQMANLRVLLLNENPNLTELPAGLATCGSLCDILIDVDIVREPPQSVSSLGTKAIIDYLAGSLRPDEIDAVAKLSPTLPLPTASRMLLDSERDRIERELETQKTAQQKTTSHLLEAERRALEKDHQLEAVLHDQQQQKRQHLLREIQEQQLAQGDQINQIQSQQNENRDILIRNIMETEEQWTRLVKQSIEVKSFMLDPLLVEQEANEQNRMLESLRVEQDGLRNQEILKAMEGLLQRELNQVEMYQQQRVQSNKDVLIKETENDHLLMGLFKDYDRNKSKMVANIQSDEAIQKTAVATLIAKNDGRSWALVEQMKIIENQLSAMSIYEMDKRKEFTTQQMNELAERRVNLTHVLLELLAQQDMRKKQLLDTLIQMENERADRRDFWLLQYQRLLDTQPDSVGFEIKIDPELGSNFLVNGVVHCMPFLSKLWKEKGKLLDEINDSDLVAAGIRSESDRLGILLSVAQFLDHSNARETHLKSDGGSPGSSKCSENEETVAADDINTLTNDELQLAECVICMDAKVSIIFLLCGHLACCDDCHDSVDICPICRASIQQRIRVIQP